ncbi:hypothetical protein [Mycoplasma sp. 2634B]|uniref:hypothetical protein n=1 Tax=Mycoplasma sp. 2634B TaxID=3401692 RepID=UPI003AB01215
MNKLKTILLAMSGTTIALLPIAATVACNNDKTDDKKPTTPSAQPGTSTPTPGTGTPSTQPGTSTPTPGTGSTETKLSAIEQAAKAITLPANKYLDNATYRSYLNASAYTSVYNGMKPAGIDENKYDGALTECTINDAEGKVEFNFTITDKTDKSKTASKKITLSGFRPTTADEIANINSKEVKITTTTKKEDIDALFTSKPKYISYYFKDSMLNIKKGSDYISLSDKIFDDPTKFQLCQADDVLYEKEGKNKKMIVNPSSRLTVKRFDASLKTITIEYRILSVVKGQKHANYIVSERKEMTLTFTPAETVSSTSGSGEKPSWLEG